MTKIFTKKRAILILIYLFLAVIVFCVFDIYFLKGNTFLSKQTSKFIPYPALVINNKFITLNQYNEFLADYKKYFENFDNNNADLLAKQSILRNQLLEQILRKMGGEINPEEFRNFTVSFYKDNNISNPVLGKEKFDYYFLKPIFAKRKILEKLSDDKLNLENKKKIDEIYADLVKNPEKFSEYKELHKDTNLDFNDQIGWLSYNDLPDYLKGGIWGMELGEFTPVMKSISGYHIYKLTGKIKYDDTPNFYYQFKQIFLPIYQLEDYLNNFLKNSKIYLLVGDEKEVIDNN